MLYFRPVKKGSNQLEKKLIEQLQTVVATEPNMNGLDLFLAMSIFRLTLLPQFAGRFPDKVQVNLIKDGATTGCKIIQVDKGMLAYAVRTDPKPS